MEFALREAKARLSELVAATRTGERVVITKHGQLAIELVRGDGAAGLILRNWKQRADGLESRMRGKDGRNSASRSSRHILPV